MLPNKILNIFVSSCDDDDDAQTVKDPGTYDWTPHNIHTTAYEWMGIRKLSDKTELKFKISIW